MLAALQAFIYHLAMQKRPIRPDAPINSKSPFTRKEPALDLFPDFAKNPTVQVVWCEAKMGRPFVSELGFVELKKFGKWRLGKNSAITLAKHLLDFADRIDNLGRERKKL